MSIKTLCKFLIVIFCFTLVISCGPKRATFTPNEDGSVVIEADKDMEARISTEEYEASVNTKEDVPQVQGDAGPLKSVFGSMAGFIPFIN